MAAPVVDILMYHSISDSGGPTSIPAPVFATQMAAIAEAGVPVIRLDDLLAAQAGGVPLPSQSVILTFDDGFLDFAETAFPILQRHGFPAMVYLPTRHVGHSEAWQGANNPPRPLVGWGTVRDLAAAGIDFGSHTVSHPDLCSLPEAVLDSELSRSRAELEDRLGRRIDHFAPPYGRATPAIRSQIARHYSTSVTTRLDRARGPGDLHDLPRLEMFYFTAAAPWRRHLRNRGAAYLAARKTLRALRDATSKPWERP